jgi:hypothetical protein
MNQILIEEIRRNRKMMNINEADIQGIDELVYNPATKSGGDIGHGYDGGIRKKGLTWSGHDDHLHIGFTNRDVAMKVIDKADQMGLRTTENPYAKKDPNGKVDKVHTNGSFHYNTFPGEPKVGAGVDISGDKGTIVKLIKWIENEYSHGNYSIDSTTKDVDSTSTSSSSTAKDKLNNILNSDYNGESIGDLIDSVENPLEVLSKLFKLISSFVK